MAAKRYSVRCIAIYTPICRGETRLVANDTVLIRVLSVDICAVRVRSLLPILECLQAYGRLAHVGRRGAPTHGRRRSRLECCG